MKMRCLETVIKLTEILTFTKDELLRFLIIKLVNGKSVCPDGIAAEAFKYCDFDDILLNYSNKILFEKQKPSQ